MLIAACRWEEGRHTLTHHETGEKPMLIHSLDCFRVFPARSMRKAEVSGASWWSSGVPGRPAAPEQGPPPIEEKGARRPGQRRHMPDRDCRARLPPAAHSTAAVQRPGETVKESLLLLAAPTGQPVCWSQMISLLAPAAAAGIAAPVDADAEEVVLLCNIYPLLVDATSRGIGQVESLRACVYRVTGMRRVSMTCGAA